MQEFIPAQDAHIVRVEVLNGKYLYAIKVHITGETFDLCPADICRTTTGTDLNRAACAIDAPKTGITVEAFNPPADAIRDVELLMQHSGIDIGGVEYITDSRDGQRYYYDINALSNFVADGPRVIGFDPFAKLVDWLEAEAGITRAAVYVRSLNHRIGHTVHHAGVQRHSSCLQLRKEIRRRVHLHQHAAGWKLRLRGLILKQKNRDALLPRLQHNDPSRIRQRDLRSIRVPVVEPQIVIIAVHCHVPRSVHWESIEHPCLLHGLDVQVPRGSRAMRPHAKVSISLHGTRRQQCRQKHPGRPSALQPREDPRRGPSRQ